MSALKSARLDRVDRLRQGDLGQDRRHVPDLAQGAGEVAAQHERDLVVGVAAADQPLGQLEGPPGVVQAGDEGIRFLLVSGRPIEEPVAWYGPIVMNTQDELQQAFAELREGTFIK